MDVSFIRCNSMAAVEAVSHSPLGGRSPNGNGCVFMMRCEEVAIDGIDLYLYSRFCNVEHLYTIYNMCKMT